jgi:hypothetical protein
VNSPCPSNREWLSLVDGEATENRAAELRAHAGDCSRCARELEMQRQLVRDLTAPVPVSSDAVAAVMRQIDKAERPVRRLGWRSWALTGGALAAAVVVTLLIVPSTGIDPGIFSARGHRVPWTQKVGVEVWAIESSPRKLEAGATLSPTTAMVASYHNVDAAAAYLMVFALDTRGEIHWAYPGFEDAKSDPASVRLEPLQMHRVLPDSVLLDELPAGPLELVTFISRELTHVSRIETLPVLERSVASLHARFPSARIESLSLRVVPASAAPGKAKP